MSLAMVGVAAVLYAIMWVYFRGANKKRRAGKEDGKINGMTEEQIAEMGDESPRFMFTY